MIPEKRHLGDETYSITDERKKMKEELEQSYDEETFQLLALSAKFVQYFS